MPGAPEIYFHKAIDNSRLVRTRDIRRGNEMPSSLPAWCLFFFMMLIYAAQH